MVKICRHVWRSSFINCFFELLWLLKIIAKIKILYCCNLLKTFLTTLHALWICMSVETCHLKSVPVQCEILEKSKSRAAHLTVITLWRNFLHIYSTPPWCVENRTICRNTLIKISKKLSFSLCILINICPIYMSDKQSQNEWYF